MLPLALLFAGAQAWGLSSLMRNVRDSEREAEQGRRTDFFNRVDESMNPPIPGQTTADRQATMAQKLMTSPDFDQFSGGLLQQAMRNQQAQSQFENISAYQQQQLALQQQAAQRAQQMTDAQKIDEIQNLRGEYMKEQKFFVDMRRQYAPLMESLAKGETGADTLISTFGLMKTIDPNGVVQQGDIAAVLASFGMKESVINQLLKTGGGGMSYESRKQIADGITKIYNQRYQDALINQERYKAIVAADLGSMQIPYDEVQVFGAVNLEPYEMPKFVGEDAEAGKPQDLTQSDIDQAMRDGYSPEKP